MRKFSLFIFALLTIGVLSCNNSNTVNTQATDTAKTVSAAPETPIKNGAAKLEVFNNISETRSKLSNVGIGQLGEWKDDPMNGYMSTSDSNNLAYRLRSDDSSFIKKLELVVNIHDKNRKGDLREFSQTVEKTYSVLGLTPNPKIIAASKTGKKVTASNDNYLESIETNGSKNESWVFIIETKFK